VVADRLAIAVDTVYNNPAGFNSLSLLIATFFFSFQIFYDFSGYSDIAIGAARIMGFKLMTNFNRPYLSKSIQEFWKRWHISLSSWFKDYLYISLGGNRVTIPRWYLNLFIVFLVSGLWHGANWTFVIWGALHGFYSVFALLTRTIRKRINHLLWIDHLPALQILSTFVLVAFSWIFFRAKNLDTALYIIKHIFSGIPELFSQVINHQSVIQNIGIGMKDLILSFILIFFIESVHLFQSRVNISDFFTKRPDYIRWAVYSAYVIVFLFLGIFENREFIYFQF
jgi:D-alanyl-lipoteichoic acid acyltransferase DltB (MBOAT superfamily)